MNKFLDLEFKEFYIKTKTGDFYSRILIIFIQRIGIRERKF